MYLVSVDPKDRSIETNQIVLTTKNQNKKTRRNSEFVVGSSKQQLFLFQGNTRDVLHKFTVDLPKKHGRGGQSALRFAR